MIQNNRIGRQGPKKGSGDPGMGMFLTRFLIAALVVALLPVAAAQAAPAGYTEYYIPADEEQLFDVFDIISYRNETGYSDIRMHAIISITAWSDSTTLYYDHWEDGYDFDPDNPTSFPADETYYIRSTCAGGECTGNEIIAFEDADITLPRLPVGSCDIRPPDVNADHPANPLCNYDGRDRIYIAGGTATMTRAGWIEGAPRTGPGTLLAVSWEVYPVRPQLTTYIMPFGEELPGDKGYQDFNRVFALVQATEDNTVVTVDYTGDGTPDNLNTDRAGGFEGASVTLNRGEVFLLSREAINDTGSSNVLRTGTTIKSDKTLQVQYIIGEEGSNYEIRGLSAFPRGFWDNAYYIPVGSPTAGDDPADAYIYNPHQADLIVNYTTASDSGSFTVPPGEVFSYYDGVELDKGSGNGAYLPQNSPVYLSANDVFWGVVSIDTEETTHDWGHSMVPASMLADEHHLAWAPGAYPVSLGNPDDSGLYVAAAQDHIKVFVDYRDGRPIETHSLNRLESLFLYDSVDGDMSKAHIWSTGVYTAAYGQNPDTAAAGAPAIDVGYTIISDTDFFDIVLNIDKTVEPAVLATAAGQQSTITLKVNSFFYPVDNVVIKDLLPAGWKYVSGSAVITRADGSVVASGVTDPEFSIGSLEENQSVIVTFTAETTKNFNDGDVTKNQATATGTRTVEGTTQTFVAADKAFHFFTNSSLSVTKTSDIDSAVSPGDTITYTVEVKNNGDNTLTDVALYDALPTGVSYADPPNTTLTLTTVPSEDYADSFATQVYSRNDGSRTWTGDWLETNDDSSATAGLIQVGTDGSLEISGQSGSTTSIERTADLSGGIAASVSFDYIPNALVGSSDALTFSVHDGTSWHDLGTYGDRTNIVRNLDITPYMNSASRVRFTAADGSFPTVSGNVRDEFTDQTYHNNDGSANWVTSWLETNDDDDVTSGAVYVRDAQDDLQISGVPGGSVSVSRDVDLSGATSATLTFDYTPDAGVDADDTLRLFVNGTEEKIFSNSATTANVDLSSHLGSTVTISLETDSGDFVNTPAAVSDNFSGGYSGGSGWTGNWIEDPNTDRIRVNSNRLQFRETISSDSAVARRADLSAFSTASSVTLNFDSDQNSTESSDSIKVQVCGDASGSPVTCASGWTDLPSVNMTADEAYSQTFDTALLTSDFALRFLAENLDGGGTEYVYIDNIEIIPVLPEPAYIDNINIAITGKAVARIDNVQVEYLGTPVPGQDASAACTLTDVGNPPNFISGDPNHCDLNPNESLVLTFEAIVDDPFPTGQTEITNTVEATSSEVTIPETASVTDPVVIPPSELAKVGDRVWFDLNSNGIVDVGENGIAGVRVVLKDEFGTPVAETVTDSDGFYIFEGVTPGDDYWVQVDKSTLPGYDSITDTTNFTQTTDSRTDHRTNSFNLVAGDEYLNADIGYVPPAGTATFGDLVWSDADGDNVQDPGETGLGGVTVELWRDIDGDGVFEPTGDDAQTPLTTVTTDNGGYLFTGATAAGTEDYFVTVDNSQGALTDWTSTGFTTTVDSTVYSYAYYQNVDAGDVNLDADFGFDNDAGTATIKDRIWFDVDADGDDDNSSMDNAETGISSVTVVLKDSSGDIVSTTTVTSDSNGEFEFTGVPVGERYTIEITDVTGALNGYYPTTDGAVARSWQMPGVLLGDVDYTSEALADRNDGETEPHFGFALTNAIGDTVFEDNGAGGGTPGDGAQNGNEPGIAGVEVKLYVDTNGDGILQPGEIAADPVATETTDINGNYLFAGLTPDTDYVVSVTTPANYIYSPGTPDSDSATDGEQQASSLPADGTPDLDRDFGYVADPTSHSINGSVWENSIENAVIDSSESGFAGVTVALYESDGTTLITTTTTDSNGNYSFNALNSGDYVVKVTDSSGILGGYDANYEITEGVAAGSYNYQEAVTVGSSDVNNINFGFVDPAPLAGTRTVSGQVRLDTDGDGDPVDSDSPITGVVINLYSDPNGDGDPSDGSLIASTVTDSSGNYSFSGLASSDYVITEEDPAGHSSTYDVAGSGTDNQIAVDLSSGDVTNQDFLDTRPGTIGNRVWLDENGDGVQDAGEAGIPNVTVELRDSGDNLVSSTITGDNGEYIFTNVPPGDYTVRVVNGITNLHNTYDKDDTTTNPNNETSITVTAGKTDLTADFGYNWASTDETDTPDASAKGAIGDRIWNDANGDGVQDPGESGIKDVTVTLFTDHDNDGVYDNVAGTATTDATGRYIFDDLDPGSYVVEVTPPAGTTQTGDPDAPGDNKTTLPVILAPGDVYVNADFGYKTDGLTSSIGDRIYLDANGDGIDDGIGTEPGFAGVTVTLKNGSGEIIAYDVTDKDGKYSFPGLPSGDYTVEVTDTRNVLGQFSQTGDPDGSFDSAHTLNVPAGTSVDTVDFGYAPAGHSTGEGLIGDTIFLDLNNDGDADPGEGMEGVTVELYDNTGTILLQSTVTDSNGNYAFGNLHSTGTYTVRVDTATLPGTGLTNTVDPDGTAPLNESVVNLNASGGIDLDQDFGYRDETDPNNISGTIWNDTNADGVLSGETGFFEGVTVVLRDQSTGNIVASTTTDVNGNYNFGNLPDGTYTVDVVDTTGVLNGYWHSVGPNAGDGTTDNNSQEDPYTVTVGTGNRNDSTGDFGYYKTPASVGNLVWNDLDGDGIRDAGEPGIDGVPVTATVTYENGVTFTITTTTHDGGQYNFDNLLLDEDYKSSGGTGQPSYVIQVDPPAGTASTHTPATDTANNDNEADNPEGEFVALTQGEVLESKDFGFRDSGSIGDYIWLDINGDGVQDLNELPLGGVRVNLYRDDGDGMLGGDDIFETFAVTALDGSYLFENLPKGGYWVQIDGTTLPGNLEITTTHSDNGQLAHFVTLPPNTNDDTVDFGFNATATTAVLGDTVWFDADANGIQDPGEVGIAGVGLYICLNDVDPCDGTTDIDTGSTNPTVVTGADGSWLVTGLDPNQTYTVAVDTGSAALSGLDNNNPTNGDVRRVYTMPATGGLLIADYGFTDNDGTQSYGTIGDRVYQDANGDSDDEGGSDPGISGVTVELLNNSGAVIATTVTDTNGNYTFTGLELDKEYKVRIKGDDDILSTMTRTETGPDDNSYTFTPTAATPDETGANFGFRNSGSDLGDYVWFDENGNGVQDAGENGISNVEVRLYLDNGTTAGSKDGGDTLVRTVTTDSNGKYLFSGLETDKNYIVEVVPPAGFTPTVTTGGDEATDSDGTDKGTGNSETALTFTATTMDVDFGFTGGSYSIGDRVWFDSDGSAGINGSEVGIEGVTVDLYDSDGHRIATTVTDSTGSYRFENLPEGTYEVQVSDQSKLLTNYGSTTGGFSQAASVSSSNPHDTKNFGVNYPLSTYAVVSSFDAYVDASNQVVLEWKTASEVGTIGFLLERLNEQSGKYQAVTRKLLPGMLAAPHGGTYRFVDKTAKAGTSYTYRVVEVAVNHQGTVSGPYMVKAEQALPVRRMFSDGPEGYTLTHERYSEQQLMRFAARDESVERLAAEKKKKTGDVLKIPVNRSGLVYLTAAELATSSGLPEQQVVQYLKAKKCLITLQGESVAVVTANTGSALWFYGQAPARSDIGRNIYLLELGKNGVKMANKPGRVDTIIDAPQAFAAHNKVEENHQPFHLYINTPVKDFWAWEYLLAYGDEYTVRHSIDAPHLTGQGTTTVTVNLVGVSNNNSGQEAPYKVAVSLNGTEIGTTEWSEKGDHQFQAEVSTALLQENGNEVQLVSQLNSGVVYSVIYLDSIELDYERNYEAVNGELMFSNADYDSITVRGFSGSSVLALDITDPNKPLRMRTLPGKNEAGEYTITILAEPDHNYYITENIRQTVSGDMTVDSPSQLRNTGNQADYLVISPLSMMDSAQRLADHRASQGMTALVVDIEDIQDEFSHGLAAPEAVRNFLTYVHSHWTQVPAYVLLVGDGSYDYKDYLGYGYPLVPTEMVATPEGFFPSDNVLADIIGNDGVPEFAVGRIPAVDTAELDQYIDKLIGYEQSVQSSSGTVMALVTDKADPKAGDFQGSAGQVNMLVPEAVTVNRFDAQTQGVSTVRSQVLATLQQGAGILHYIGHSSMVSFGSNTLLSANDIDTMSNIGSPMLMISMACSTASFGYPPMSSIGERAVLRADGAAVGFFGATGLSLNYLADIMAEGFYRNLFDPATFRVGDAVVLGKRYFADQSTERSTLDIYNLLGDPAMLAPVQ